MSKKQKTCCECQHGEFVSVSRLQPPRKMFEGEKLCIYCKKFHTYGRRDRLMCASAIPENREQYFHSLGLKLYRGFLVPDNLSLQDTYRAYTQAKKEELRMQRKLIRKRTKKN